MPFANGRDGHPIGLLLAGLSDRLALDGDYRDFVALVAGQISTAVVSARGFEAARAARARRRALRDGLTGLPNRVSFLDRLGRALARAEAGGWQDRVGLLFVDLDGFKAVNDLAGHQAGDLVLREVATRLRRAVRPGDTVARLAGDEFAVLCEGITSAESVLGIADRIVETAAVRAPSDGPPVTSSIGVAVSAPGLTDPRAILHAADIAMYAAKRRGRNCRVLFDESLRTPATRRRPRLAAPERETGRLRQR
ncbi:diguanylate cyclase (GGDEF) domain-containing protein [Frankia torreyi]|uniref:Diguanylate cyclase (GGDEF) domain-containing protein n=1 Tax=Frankia torreyi TaxID=1856 RepID=A0A0D8BEP9_9ACTN|nr:MULTISPECIES: GGDEF domain-containing protein [Frankia]KJE21872.1 diguanylate cyclase (GGDEF) domain-containing protein [Frankia torreyi]KQM05249.1 diguanylate cyclase (GGDEF) domain-containing protein [Frankia sp. CpI1-P]